MKEHIKLGTRIELHLCLSYYAAWCSDHAHNYIFIEMRLNLKAFKRLFFRPKSSTEQLVKTHNELCISHLKMVLVSGGEFLMGTDNPGIPPDGEGPQRLVHVDSFYMDIQEVTNRQFQGFVDATGYVTEVRDVCTHTFISQCFIM